jgi:hypothetical protein
MSATTSMKHLILITASCFLVSCGTKFTDQTFVGPGPDPACGGTELNVTKKGSRIVVIQQTYYASSRTLVEKFTPLQDDIWQVSLMLYSSRWQNNEALTPDRLIRTKTFQTNITENEAMAINREFGFNSVDWEKEPARLLNYFNSNQTEFQPE